MHRGAPHPHSAPRSGAARTGCRLSEPHPYLHAHEFQIPSLQWGFPAGTMGACAGRSRPDVPSCRQNPAAAAPRRALFMPIKCGLTVSDHVRPGPARWLTEPQSLTVASIVSRRAGRCSDLACGSGVHHIGTAPARSGCCAGGMAGFPSLTRTCTHTNSKYRLRNGVSSRHDGPLCRLLPAQGAIVPARSGNSGSRTRYFCEH